jgi:hypothetical protein
MVVAERCAASQAETGARAAAHLAGAQTGDDRAREAADGHGKVRGAHDLQPALRLQARAREARSVNPVRMTWLSVGFVPDASLAEWAERRLKAELRGSSRQ